MKAITLKNKIIELREGLYFEIEDQQDQHYIIEGMGDGWRLCTPSSSLIICFNNVLTSGNDVYLAKQIQDGEQDIFAILDAEKWEIDEE